MELGPVLLSRLQFAWVIGWHILLPAFTVGIASFIALLESLRLSTGREVYGRISTFLGAGWLILKTEGAVQAAARRQGRICLIGVLLGISTVSIWTPLKSETIAERWFASANIAFFAPVPLATAAVAWLTWRALGRSEAQATPFLGAIGLFVLSYLGIAISLYPMIVPPISRCGRRHHPAARGPSCLSARSRCRPWSSCTPDGRIGCSAARSALRSATTDSIPVHSEAKRASP